VLNHARCFERADMNNDAEGVAKPWLARLCERCGPRGRALMPWPWRSARWRSRLGL
jgi:hypothetical protein